MLNVSDYSLTSVIVNQTRKKKKMLLDKKNATCTPYSLFGSRMYLKITPIKVRKRSFKYRILPKEKAL